MRVREVYIERFGQYHEQVFIFPEESFLVIEGANETGKTTLVHFIKYMLFGFPSKATLKSLGFLGEEESLMGGRLVIELPMEGNVTIRRHLRKNNGEATLYFEDGSQKNEDTLKEWLHGMDLALFNSVFTLDLDGLKDVHRLKPEDLQYFLFSTGMMGNAKIMELEKQLEKETQERFRPMGKNPSINQTLNQLEQVNERLKIWESKKEDYAELKRKRDLFLEQVREGKKKQKDLLETKQSFTEFKSVEPYLIRLDQLNKELETFPIQLDNFPVNGKERYESWRTQLVMLEGEKADVTNQLRTHLQDLEKIEEKWDPRWQEENEQIQALLENQTKMDLVEVELGKVEERIDNESEGLESLLLRLDPEFSLDRQHLKNRDTSLIFKQELSMGLKEIDRINQERGFIEREWANLETEKNELDSVISRQTRLHSKEREEGKRLASLKEKQGSLVDERDRLETEQRTLLETMKQQNRLRQIALFQLGIGFIIAVALFVGVYIRLHNWWGAVLSLNILVISCVIGSILFVLSKNKTTSQNRLKEIRKRLLELERTFNDLIQNEDLLYRYINDEKNRLREQELKERREVISQKQDLKQKELEANDQLLSDRQTFLRENLCKKGYPLIQDLSLTMDYLEGVEEAKERLFTIERLEATRLTLKRAIEETDSQLMSLGKRLEMAHLNFVQLRVMVEQMEGIQRERHELFQNQKRLTNQLTTYEEKIARFKEECYNLWGQAGADSEDAFYALASLWEKREENLKEKEHVLTTLRTIATTTDRLQLYFDDYHTSRWKGKTSEIMDAALEENDGNQQTIQASLETVTLALRQIEEDDTHADLIHQFVQLRDQLDLEAREWAVYKTALGLLHQAKEAYKSTRLPKLVESAELYFSAITEGAYQRVYYHEKDGFSVEHINGAIYRAEELSRGTAEQLYVSIRLALVDLYESRWSLPLLVDDGFVNFDPSRLGNMMGVLHQTSKNRQVLFLTCQSMQQNSLRMDVWKEAGRKVAN